MKKIFTLIASAVFAITATAQTISFTEAAEKGTLDGKEFSADGLVLKVTDTDGKMNIDANNAWFGTSTDDKVEFAYRLKSGGKSGSKNQMTLTVPTDGTLKIYARTGSNSATDRNIVVTGEAEVVNHILLESEMIEETYTTEEGTEATRKIYTPVSADVTAGTYTITYPVGSINIYGIELATVSSSISSISETAKVSAPAKRLTNRGLVIEKNGMEFSATGARLK